MISAQHLAGASNSNTVSCNIPRYQHNAFVSTCAVAKLTLLRYHGVYVTPVLFDSRFCLNCREYWHRLLRILS